jgi:hypothetical protein
MADVKSFMEERGPMFSISKNTSSRPRTELCIEDVYIPHIEILKELKLISVLPVGEEQIYVFKEPFRVPHFNLFYASKITSASDKYLPELITRLYYLNPGTDEFNLKRITEFVLQNFVTRVHAESEVMYGKEIMVPSISYTKMNNMVKIITSAPTITSYLPDTERYIMYSRNSKLSREEKIGINAKIRAAVAVSYYEKAIHNATEYLIELGDSIKISYNSIKETNLAVDNGNKQLSISTIHRHIAPRTKKVIDEVNRYRYFKSELTRKKFKKFLTLPSMTLDEYTKKLAISKSTALEFKQIKQKYEEDPDHDKKLFSPNF